MLEQVYKFHQTRRGFAFFGVVELVLAYSIGTFAQDSANMWAYAATILLLVGGIVNLIGALRFKEGKQVGANTKHQR